jgi:hypothetical protein
MLYDVMTKDEKLAGLLSDNKTHGSAIENKISKETGVTIQAGKSYIIKIVVGLESVKFTVEVTDWQPKPATETDVDMPFNPGYAKVQADELPLGAVYYLYPSVENPAEFKVPTLFNKTFVSNYTRETVAVDEDYEDYYYFGYFFEYRVAKKGFADKINEGYKASGDYISVTVQEFDKDEAKYVDQSSPVYFFSQKLVIPGDPAPAPFAALQAGSTFHFTPSGSFDLFPGTYTPQEGDYVLGEETVKGKEYWKATITCKDGFNITQKMVLYFEKDTENGDYADGETKHFLIKKIGSGNYAYMYDTETTATISEVEPLIEELK